ncbi:hypothetical protein RintRC_7715 [Richelia intracellularis]|nr:hypothetical protein RintRC_7715 [Richelia intracellularis]
MSSYINEAPFDTSMLVHFRERISGNAVNKVNQMMEKQYKRRPLKKQRKNNTKGFRTKKSR